MKPIIMSAESVRAILDGRKTQTRRVVKPQPVQTEDMPCHWLDVSVTWWEWKTNVRQSERALMDNLLEATPYPIGSH